MASSLPDDWHEVQSPDHITEKYRARNPTLFVHDDHDVAVHVLPASTSSPHDRERYRVGAFRGSADDFENERAIGVFENRDRAFERAFEFAHRYEDACETRDEAAAIDAAVERVS